MHITPLSKKMLDRIEYVQGELNKTILKIQQEMDDMSSLEIRVALLNTHGMVCQMEIQEMIRNNIDPATNEPFKSPESDN